MGITFCGDIWASLVMKSRWQAEGTTQLQEAVTRVGFKRYYHRNKCWEDGRQECPKHALYNSGIGTNCFLPSVTSRRCLCQAQELTKVHRWKEEPRICPAYGGGTWSHRCHSSEENLSQTDPSKSDISPLFLFLQTCFLIGKEASLFLGITDIMM